MGRVKEQNVPYVVDSRGKRVSVVLAVATYERLLEAERELDDIRAYDKARRKVKSELQSGDYLELKNTSESARNELDEIPCCPSKVCAERFSQVTFASRK